MEQANQASNALPLATVCYLIRQKYLLTALLKALAQKLIPGISRNIRILYLSQIESEVEVEQSPTNTQPKRGSGQAEDSSLNSKSTESVLDFVTRGDKERTAVLEQWKSQYYGLYVIRLFRAAYGSAVHFM